MTNITDGKWEGEFDENIGNKNLIGDRSFNDFIPETSKEIKDFIRKVEQDAVRRTRNEAANETVSLIRKLSGHYGKVDTDYLEKELMIEVFPEVPIPGDLSAITKEHE